MRKKRFRDEYGGAALGDIRRSERLTELGMALASQPAISFPEALGDGAALEAAYRFLSNESVEAGKVLRPHYRETISRCAKLPSVVIAHDTSSFVFPGEKRQGLGRIQGGAERGFFGHFAVAVSLDELREPLGALHLETWTRTAEIKESAKKGPRERQRDPDRESMRWARGVKAVEAQFQDSRAIHVMDREGDDYGFLATLVAHDWRFVIRSKANRRVEGGKLLEAVAKQEIIVTREVPLSVRKSSLLPRSRRVHPPRQERAAVLGIKAGVVALLRPRDLISKPPEELPKQLRVNVVVVEELNCPEGETPITWRLFTTEPINTPKDLERVVDNYRCRWRIEEFFKALKTGCAIEKRQLESGHALVNALAVYIPIAWRVLRHRTLAHSQGGNPASLILSELQLRLLHRKKRLSKSASIADALIAVAALGGHLKRNGLPGWITLARGYERLLTLEEGALLYAKM